MQFCLCDFEAYGFEHLVSLHNLEKVGLLRVQGVGRTYATVRKSLKLIDEKVNEQVACADSNAIIAYSLVTSGSFVKILYSRRKSQMCIELCAELGVVCVALCGI